MTKGLIGNSIILSISIFFAFLLIHLASALTLSCSIVPPGLCGGTVVALVQNDTGGYDNAHAQNSSIDTYSYSLCCTSDSTLLQSCAQATVIKLENLTNSHVQTGNYAGPSIIYNYSSCLSSSPGKVQCTYPDAACSAGYTCLGSMASSELSDSNETNAHIASCNTYKKKICCKLNTPPVVSNAVLNSTLRTNYTTENLTVYFSQVDADNDFTTNITDWRINGNSIAILNMPFNTEENSRTARAVRDYSTFSNNGTLKGSTNWTSRGAVGGAYIFDGDGDFVNSTIEGIGSKAITQCAWINISSTASERQIGYILSSGTTSSRYFYFSTWCAAGAPYTCVHLGTLTSGGDWGRVMSSPRILEQDRWYFVCGEVNAEAGNVKLYVNGELNQTSAIAAGDIPGAPNYITLGASPEGGGTNYFNGTIDEVQVFNRTLSAAQIREMYLAGLAGMSLQKIHSDETSGGQTWSCSVTANDGMDGNTIISNNLTIRNSLPTVALLSPQEGNSTTNRAPMFTWVGTDSDGDSLTYEINLTAMFLPGSVSTCSDVLTATTANEYYMPTRDLECLRDNGMVYDWSVRAHDAEGYGAWSETRTLNITAFLAISLPVNAIEFGSMRILESNDTTDDSPESFVVQNDGNSLQNINITAAQLWQSVPDDNQYYQYKVRNMTGEEGAFNWSSSTTSFTNFSVNDRVAIHRLNYSNIRDSARLDVRAQVPPNEPPALRNSTVTFMAILGER